MSNLLHHKEAKKPLKGHGAAQLGTEKRLPNKAVFSYGLLLVNGKPRARRQHDAPCHGPADKRKALICKESVSLLMALNAWNGSQDAFTPWSRLTARLHA